jgi:hypothetical protein
MRNRCHAGEFYLVPAGGAGSEVAVCCAVCHSILAIGPRTEVCADT